MTLVASWNPVVFADDLFIIFPAASELEDAVVERWGVERGLVALDSAVLEHVEVVVASFSLVVELWNAEEVGVTLAGDWHKLSWRSNDLEDRIGNELDRLVALWDLVGWVVDGLVPAATSDGDALEFRDTRETTVVSLVEKRLDFRVRIDRCESGEWILDRSSVDNRVKLETVSEKTRALCWWSKSSVPDRFLLFPFGVDILLSISNIKWNHRASVCGINNICCFTVDIFEQELACDRAVASRVFGVLIQCPLTTDL